MPDTLGIIGFNGSHLIGVIGVSISVKASTITLFFDIYKILFLFNIYCLFTLKSEISFFFVASNIFNVRFEIRKQFLMLFWMKPVVG